MRISKQRDIIVLANPETILSMCVVYLCPKVLAFHFLVTTHEFPVPVHNNHTRSNRLEFEFQKTFIAQKKMLLNWVINHPVKSFKSPRTFRSQYIYMPESLKQPSGFGFEYNDLLTQTPQRV